MSTQEEMFDPKAHARRSDPATSHAAAASVTKIRETQRKVLEVLKTRGPSTDEEIWAALPPRCMSVSGARTRRSELVTLGLVVDSGARRKTVSGRLTTVWMGAIANGSVSRGDVGSG